MERIKHRLAHLFGWNTGHVYYWYDSNTGDLMFGFKCDVCGDIGGVHRSSFQETQKYALGQEKRK